MRKVIQTDTGSGIYLMLRDLNMSDAERRGAIDALRKAEMIVDAVLWIKNKVAAAGNFFLKPSLKH